MILGAGRCAAALSPLTPKPRAGTADARAIAARMDRWWPRPTDSREHLDEPGLFRVAEEIQGASGAKSPEPPEARGSGILRGDSGLPWVPALLPDSFPEELLLVGPAV
ncbi:hypothetical protein [Yinghuangia sp. YIM S10712]|uniref:hypothetical protein n=1 Tax=Yinghuangia sp. YIM S10712 TaxID=3436930 RepID=UPI003F52C951